MRQSARAIVIKDDQLLVMKRNKFGKEYCTLIGGGVDPGETIEEALHREIQEETSLKVTRPRLLITMDAGQEFGVQYIYLCEYAGGEPMLASDSEEALSNDRGQDLFTPAWLPLNELAKTEFFPLELKELILGWIVDGWPKAPLRLTTRA